MASKKTLHEICNEADVALGVAARAIRNLRGMVRDLNIKLERSEVLRERYARLYGEAVVSKNKVRRQLAAQRGATTRLKGKS